MNVAGRRPLGYRLLWKMFPVVEYTKMFGHAGMGGSIGFADPFNRVGFGCVMNKLHSRGCTTCKGRSTARSSRKATLRASHSYMSKGRLLLVMMAGLPGSGKSTLADGVVAALGSRTMRFGEEELFEVPEFSEVAVAFRTKTFPDTTMMLDAYRTFFERVRSETDIAAGTSSTWTGPRRSTRFWRAP